MSTASTTIFRSNKTQAVRLPKAVAFPDGVKEVEIVVVGDSRIVSPAGRRFTEWAKRHPPFPDFERPPQPPLGDDAVF
ncbi:MAG TPA: type II toxin-antitoxin system VapB family antitoxin [Methylocystis sp.]|nr:type II toxin-antitoxin system VapB family antitoxin [Methylocystis sp.]